MMEPESRGPFGGGLLIPVLAIVALIVIVVLLVMLLTGGSGDSEEELPSPTPTVVATPTVPAGSAQESAIIQYVATTQEAEYAGKCSDADATADVGKLCSIYRGERENIHAFVLGMTFSEGIEWVFVEMRAGVWQVAEVIVITPENAAVPGIPWPLRIGAEVIVTGTGNCLNVRTSPGGDAVDCINDGTPISLAAGPEEAPEEASDRARESLWWRVEGRDGWVAADYLRYPDSTTDPVLPTEAPEPEPTETPTP